jgi:hypothetical protein
MTANQFGGSRPLNVTARTLLPTDATSAGTGAFRNSQAGAELLPVTGR